MSLRSIASRSTIHGSSQKYKAADRTPSTIIDTNPIVPARPITPRARLAAKSDGSAPLACRSDRFVVCLAGPRPGGDAGRIPVFCRLWAVRRWSCRAPVDRPSIGRSVPRIWTGRWLPAMTSDENRATMPGRHGTLASRRRPRVDMPRSRLFGVGQVDRRGRRHVPDEACRVPSSLGRPGRQGCRRCHQITGAIRSKGSTRHDRATWP